MLASIFILILFLPAVCLPLALDTFFSSSELGEMGICLDRSDEPCPMQGYEIAGFLPDSNNVKASEEWAWEISEPLQACR